MCRPIRACAIRSAARVRPECRAHHARSRPRSPVRRGPPTGRGGLPRTASPRLREVHHNPSVVVWQAVPVGRAARLTPPSRIPGEVPRGSGAVDRHEARPESRLDGSAPVATRVVEQGPADAAGMGPVLCPPARSRIPVSPTGRVGQAGDRAPTNLVDALCSNTRLRLLLQRLGQESGHAESTTTLCRLG